VTRWAREIAVLCAAAAIASPLAVLLVLSFKDPSGAATLDNYKRAWTDASFGAALLSSTVITIATVLCVVVLGSLAAYTLARVAPRLGYRLYLLFLLGLIVPAQLGLVPLYDLVHKAHLLGTYAGIVAVYTGLQMPITVFLYTGFMRALPREHVYAALVDGATHVQTYAYVVFPLLRPVTAVVVVLNAIFVWNDFLTPLLYLAGTSKQTVPVAVYTFVGQYGTQWGPIFAAIMLATLPPLAIA
jgi:raffinose/stachyose/melibiose transport system permease protein